MRRPPRRSRPRVYADATSLGLALLGRLGQLSTRELCDWLDRWPARAAAGGLPPARVIHPAHLSRRVRRLGPYPFWLLYVALVWRAVRGGLVSGRAVARDATLLTAWSPRDPAAAGAYPARTGRVCGFKLHVLLDRASRLPLGFRLAPANAGDRPFAYPRRWFARFVLALPLRVVRADGAYWGQACGRFVVPSSAPARASPSRPSIPFPFHRKKQPLARVRHLAWWPVSYAARAVAGRFCAAAKRYYGLDTDSTAGRDAVLLRVTLTCCAIRAVALAAHLAAAPDLRLSPSRVLAHDQPIPEPF